MQINTISSDTLSQLVFPLNFRSLESARRYGFVVGEGQDDIKFPEGSKAVEIERDNGTKFIVARVPGYDDPVFIQAFNDHPGRIASKSWHGAKRIFESTFIISTIEQLRNPSAPLEDFGGREVYAWEANVGYAGGPEQCGLEPNGPPGSDQFRMAKGTMGTSQLLRPHTEGQVPIHKIDYIYRNNLFVLTGSPFLAGKGSGTPDPIEDPFRRIGHELIEYSPYEAGLKALGVFES